MAKLYINKNITRESDRFYNWLLTGDSGITYNDVNDFIGRMAENDDRIDMELYSCGGDCTEGFAIYDALRTCGKKITATVVAECASMATVIMLAAPAESRRAFRHAQFLIHEPYYPTVSGDVTLERIEELKAALQEDKKKILDIYTERIDSSRAKIVHQMEKGDWFDAERAMELGLVTEIVPESSAAGQKGERISTTTKIKKMTEKKTDKNALAKAFNAIGAALGLVKTEQSADLTLTATDGTEINVETDSGEIHVGDKASPDGTFTLEDGRTITIKDGEITEIGNADDGGEDKGKKAKKKDGKKDEAEQHDSEGNATPTNRAVNTPTVDTDRTSALVAEVARLKAELEKVKATAKTESEIKILNAVELLGGQDFLKKLPIGNLNIPREQTRGNADTKGGEASNPFRDRLEKAKAKRRDKTE